MEGGVLSYYESETASKALNTITLHLSDHVERYEEEKPDPKRNHLFKLVTLKRTLNMNADTENELVNWVNQIRAHISRSSDYTLAERM